MEEAAERENISDRYIARQIGKMLSAAVEPGSSPDASFPSKRRLLGAKGGHPGSAAGPWDELFLRYVSQSRLDCLHVYGESLALFRLPPARPTFR